MRLGIWMMFMGSVLFGGMSQGVAKGWTPKALELAEKGKLYLPDFSYAGYQWGEKAVPVNKPTHFIEKFGAIPNDGKDDTAAFQRALSALHATSKAVVLKLPKGRFIIKEILWIKRGKFVLQGSGSGSDGTVLSIPVPLEKLDPPQEMVALKQYLLKNEKRVNGKLMSLYSWSGGFLWSTLPAAKDGKLLTKAVSGKRGGHKLGLSTTAGLKKGQVVRLRWYNREGKKSSLLKHLFGDHHLKFGERLYRHPDKSLISQEVTITQVNKKSIKIKEPLLHDLQQQWDPQLFTVIFLEEVGIESLRMEFPPIAYRGHHKEAGYNGIYLTDVLHSWVRDVVVVNSDLPLSISRSKNVTVEDFAARGRKAHHTMSVKDSYGVLAKEFKLLATAIHSLSFDTKSRLSVFSDGDIEQGCLDQHSGVNHQNLFDNLRVHYNKPAAILFNHGGAKYWKPTAGSFNTFWNVQLTFDKAPKKQPFLVGKLKDAPDARLIGLRANYPIEIRYGPNPYIEGLNQKSISVPSLYRYQLKKRLGR